MVSFSRRAVWNGDFDFSIVQEHFPELKHGQVLVKGLCSGICGSHTHQIQGLFSEAIKYLSELDCSEFKGKFYSLDNIVAGFKNSIDANNIKTFIKPNA
ncbi:MAG: hypothetical protein CL906_02090 [Dehalococcoidia bacterium]|mgnify:CR=1 FL=1|nr:hypothetical protein [Dehalococcoidia bacterium]